MYITPPILELQNRPASFADDLFIRAAADISRIVHPLRKHSREPVLASKLDCEGAWAVPCSVIRDADTGQWRMWYSTFSQRRAQIDPLPRKTLHLAVSEDGIRWTRPALNLCRTSSSQDNNLCVWDDGTAVGTGRHVFYEPDEPDPSKRYKLILYQPDYYLAYSADGIRWRMAQDAPVWPNSSGDGLEETSFIFRDPIARKYRGYMRIWRRTQTIRLAGLGESDDLLQWTGPKICFSAQQGYGLGAQVYGMNVHVDAGLYHAFPWMLYTQESFDESLHETMRFKLAISRDGIDWQPVAPETDMVAMGRKPDDFDWGMMLSQCPIVTHGHEHRLYYCGMNGLHHAGHPPTLRAIGMASWTRGRLVGMAAAGDGALLTHRFILRGRNIHLNATTQPQGQVRAELLRDGGSVIPSCSLEKSIPMQGDHPDGLLRWEGLADLAPYIGQSVMLRLRLRQAEVFSFRVDANENDLKVSQGPLPLVVHQCVRPPKIDAVLDDYAWEDFDHTAVTSPFTMFTRMEEAAVQTQAMLTYDQENLYIAIQCHEPLWEQLPREPQAGPVKYSRQETIDMRLSAPEHGHHVHQFLITSQGGGDHNYSSTEGGGNIANFPGQWSMKTRVAAGKWIIELAIPYETLSTRCPAPDTRWKFNILRFRHIAGTSDKEEHSNWSCMFGGHHRNDLAGTLIFR